MLKGHIPDSTIEEVRNRTDIVALISGHITLKKAGRNYLGSCPFHKEKTPSFTVSPDKQIFYCFGCGEGGNAISFVMKINNMTFPEAIRYLAGKAGIVIPERAPGAEEREKAGVREQLVTVNRAAAAFFTKNLFSATGKKAWDYLNRRGLSEEAVRTFRLGYAVDGWRHLRDYFQKERIAPQLAEQAGLLIGKDDGGFYDRFRGRIIFPIEDAGGRTIAFGGRLIGEGDPKYLNSPESPVYVKGRNLYGLSITKDDIRRKGFVVIVEGYFDLISLWNAGVRNVVATLGTALTREHVDLIRRYTSQAAVVFDPDEAGRKALARSLALFLAGNVHMKAVILPEGYDPDDFARTFGQEKFEKLVDEADPAVEYYMDSVLGTRGSLQQDRDRLKEAVAFIVQIESVAERNLFIRRIAERFGVDEGVLKKEVSGTATPERVSGVTSRSGHAGPAVPYDAVELGLVRMMLCHPAKIAQLAEAGTLTFFTTESLKLLGQDIVNRYLKGEPIDPVFLIDQVADTALKRLLLRQMVEEDAYGQEIQERVFADMIMKMKEKWVRERKRSLNLKIRQAQESGNSTLCDALLAERNRLLNEEKASLK